MMKPQQNALQIQQDYMDAVIAAHARWQHRKGIAGLADGIGGHYGRIVRGARAEAIRKLQAWDYSRSLASQAISDAHDVAWLEIRSK